MFVLYHIDTTLIVGKPFKTEAAAKAARTRIGKGLLADGVPRDAIRITKTYGIAEKEYFHKHIEQTKTKTNLMSGKEFQQPANTPHCCDPSSETYWCM